MADTDINKLIAAAAQGTDPRQAARAAELSGWSKATASMLAAADGLQLTDAHWRVIEYLQKLYIERGPAPNARTMASALNTEFANDGGSRYLFQLLPGGPVAQGCRLAGVPAPADAQDKSFGSTF